MKILQINAVAQEGSTGRSCKELSEYINSTENRCYLAFSKGSGYENSYQIGGRFDRKIHAFLSRLFGKQAFYSKLSTRKLLRHIDNLKPDVVHLRNLHANYINLPMLLTFLAQRDIPTVVTLHDCWFYTGKCCHYTVDGCDKWRSGCGKCPRLKKDNESWFADATSYMWKRKKELFEGIPRLAVVGVSDWITGEAQKSFLASAKIIRRIYNWIDLDVFYPRDQKIEMCQKLGILGKKIVLGVASFWDESKGLDEFLKLPMALGDGYVVVLVGKLNSEIRLSDNIIHIPATTSTDELAQYYSMADVFVTFSLEESFGKVSAEALACGTPVVCYNSTANSELVGDGCGSVLEPRDIESAISAIRSICQGDQTDIVRACRSFAEEHFDKKGRIDDHLTLYKDICSM